MTSIPHLKLLFKIFLFVLFVILSSCSARRYVSSKSCNVITNKESILSRYKNRNNVFNLSNDSILITIESHYLVQFTFFTLQDTSKDSLTVTWYDSLDGYINYENTKNALYIEINDNGKISTCEILKQNKYSIIRVIYYQEKLILDFRNTKIIHE